MRKSSRGNPYHDERGRFTTADGCRKKVDYKTARDYEVQTAKRKRQANPPPAVNAYVVSDGETKVVYGNEVQKGMIVEYDPAWSSEGEEKYLHVVTDVWTNENGKTFAKITTVNSRLTWAPTERVDIEMIRPASVEKVDATEKSMSREDRRKMAKACGWKSTMDDAATYLSDKEYVSGVTLKGANVVEFEYAGMKQTGYLHIEDGVTYFKPAGGDRYVTVDRYLSTKEYEMRYDYIIEQHETNDFTEIIGSIGGDVERVRIHNNGSVGMK